MEEAEKSLLQGLREIISIKSLPASNREHKLKAEEIFRTTIRCRGINSAKLTINQRISIILDSTKVQRRLIWKIVTVKDLSLSNLFRT